MVNSLLIGNLTAIYSLRKYKTIFFICLIMILVFPLFAQGGNLKVGVFDFEPLCKTDLAEGNGGLFIEILEYTARKENWGNIHFVTGNMRGISDKLTGGSIDLMVAASYDPGSEADVSFTRETVISTWAQVYARDNNKIKSMIDLHNCTIGVVRDEPYNEKFREIIKGFDIQCEVVEFKQSKEVFKAIKEKWIDAGIVDRLYGVMNEAEFEVKRTTVIFSPIELRYAAAGKKNQKYLDALDYHLAALKENPDSIYYQLLEQTLGYQEKNKIPGVLVWVLSAALGMLLLFVGLNFLLHRQVELKTGELSDKNRELKESEKKLAAEKERLAVTLRSIGDGVITTDTDGHVVLINDSALLMTGWHREKAIGLPISQIFRIKGKKCEKGVEGLVEQVVTGGFKIASDTDCALLSHDGGERLVIFSCAPIYDSDKKILGAVLVFHDITEKRRMQKELQKAEHLESIGVLAGGIAHDFNNILTIINGNLEMATMTLAPQDDISPFLENAARGASRAAELSRQLLIFSKGGAPVKQAASVQQIIEESVNFILRGSNIKCVFDFPADFCPAEVDTHQLSQVFQNLVINAKQAMPGGGTITIDASNIEDGSQQIATLNPCKYICITVRDEGVGIPAAVIERVFDPFFTTKEEGSGLGLSIVYSIIRKHDGWITVESEAGQGTMFTIYLPATEKMVEEVGEQNKELEIGEGRILVMDDEPDIRLLVGNTLNRMGYESFFAANGEEAVAAYSLALREGRPFAAVVMDLTIPGAMGGKEAIEKLRKLDPHVKAIVCSGYSNGPVLSDYEQYGFAGAIGKPFSLQEFSRVLVQVVELDKRDLKN